MSTVPIRYHDVDAPRNAPIVPDYTELIELEVPKKRKAPKAPKRRIVVSSTK